MAKRVAYTIKLLIEEGRKVGLPEQIIRCADVYMERDVPLESGGY